MDEEGEDNSRLLLNQFVFEKGIQVFKGVTPVFQKPTEEHPFDFSPDQTVFTISPSVGQVTRIHTLDPLKKLGYTIVGLEVKNPWFPGQQAEYKLVPLRPGLLNQLGRIPTLASHGHSRCTVELDSTGRIRLVGRNAGPNMYGPWIQTKAKPNVVTNSRSLDVSDYLTPKDDPIGNAIRELSKATNTEENVEIPEDEIPIMLTEDNELLCIKLEKDIVHVGLVGKTGCIPETQEVLILRQDRIQKTELGDVNIGDEIACEYEGKTTFKPITATFDRGLQPTLRIETRTGSFECTYDHELLTIDEWGRITKKRAESFSKGDILIYANVLPHRDLITKIPVHFSIGAAHIKQTRDLPLNREWGFIIGMYLAEGISGYGTLMITNSHQTLLDALKTASESLGLTHRISRTRNRAPNFILLEGVHTWFNSQFCSGSANKLLPSWVYTSPKEFQRGIIDGYLSGDGYVDTIGRVTFTTKSQKLWEGLQALLLQQQIATRHIERHNKKYGKYYEGIVDRSFNSNLPKITHPEKRARIKAPTAKPSMYNILPINPARIGEIIRKYSLMKGHVPNPLNMALLSLQALGKKKKSMGKPRAEKLLRIVREALPYTPYPEHYLDNLDALIKSDLGFARITAISAQSEKKVRDITVADAHNFILLGPAGGVIVGNSGKTLLAHSLIDRIFWRTDNKVAILNDSVNQCYTWRKPSTTAAWNSTLSRLNENPRGLPVSIFVPNHKNIYEIPFENEMAFRETISWEWLVNNWKTFLDGSPWELGATEKYFNRYKKEFLQMRKLEELQDYFYDKAENKEINQNSADKINATLADMWNKEFIDRSTKITGKWNFKTPTEHYEEDPFVGCLRAGLVPVLNTVNLKDQHYHPQYIKYKIDQVRHYQLSIPSAQRKKMWLFIDEIGDIYKKGNEKSVAARKLVETVTQGRNFQLGAIYTIQNYTQIDPEIRNNTGYFFCFTMSSIEEGKMIAKNFGLDKGIGESLTQLQKGQCIAVTNDREWVIYTPHGERYRISGAFKGEPLPPLSMHYRPGDEL